MKERYGERKHGSFIDRLTISRDEVIAACLDEVD